MPSYKFRVLIDTDSGTEIFRDFLISSNESLEVFYDSILKAFNFKGGQMASFYKSNNDWDKGQEITLMDMGMNEGGDPVFIMSQTKLSDIVTEPDQKLILVHDFMRMWCFLIELIDTQTKAVAKPQVLLSMGEAPKEESKSLDNMDGMQFGETLDLGGDFDDIFSEDDDFEDDDLEGFSEESDESEFY